ncbi:hypothetical protein [Haloplanus aerogenes]|uniref:N-acetyltransferase domain-containing protein n=1 Tax=Haloplanus aerogenes TaxID=660522 RepID=A0A3M0CW22_9EURY|nr:hypothetical protein [Haloplanus aerogenes]AZH24066.1 hypothetical protein DU502_01165 [Haloplanus aerogenes]RMB13157.1 hypothetical protein ATH50_2488 [Haloplanus aerogenes]
MEVRDAVEADADALSAIADVPADVIRNLIHDRTVRVAQREATAAGPNADTAEEETRDVAGFVSFDVRNGTVHVTQLAGTTAACERLLGEPVRFATTEGMTVELLAIEDDEAVLEAAEAAGFRREGTGPAFDGKSTVRYRLDPAS